jgi:SET domain-containing protein
VAVFEVRQVAIKKLVPPVQPFEVRPSQVAGLGGFATRRIRKGERIIEYVGERISAKLADERYDDEAMARAGRHYTLLFTINKAVVIDATYGGNDSKFINHSCDPNCEAVIEDKRVFIDSARDIAPGDELFYDYAYDRESDSGPDAEQLYPCNCGAAKCRGTILAPQEKKRRKAAKRSAKKATKHTARKPLQRRARRKSRA